MKTKIIQASEISKAVEDAFLKANFSFRPDLRSLIKQALDAKNSPAANLVLRQLIENYRIAEEKKVPLCQDCGYPTVFVEMGQDAQIEGGLLTEAVQTGVSAAYRDNGLRQSVIADALLERTNFDIENLASINISLVRGESLNIIVMTKGGGSDNASRQLMMRPTAQWGDIVKFVLDTVTGTGIGACPPLFIGVGIGGSFDTVALLAKKSLLRRFDRPNPNKKLADFEFQLLSEINSLGIGPAGLGGESTALGVSILTAPSHMACMPVAVNVGCNSLRSTEIML